MNGPSIRLASGVLVAASLLAAHLACPSVAHAQAATPSRADLTAAKKHYGEGEKRFKAGDFPAAEAEFRAAEDIKAAPQAERYIGLCEDQQGHPVSALEWFDRFLAHAPESMTTQIDEIKKREGEIRALPGKVHVESTPPGAAIAVDDKPSDKSTPADVEVPGGAHTLKLTLAGRLPVTKPFDVAFGGAQTVQAALEPEPPPPPAPVAAAPPPPAPAPPPPPPPAPRSLVPAFVTGGLAIAAAGVGTAFGILALSDKSDFDKSPTTHTADNGDTHALICDMSFGVALTFGVTSAVLFLTKDEAPPPAASGEARVKAAKAETKSRVTVTPTPLIGAHSGGAGLLVRF